MNTRTLTHILKYSWLALALATWPVISSAQVPAAQIEEVEELPTLTSAELEELIGPIALYPDDLLAIVLPASTFPLQIVEAGRFLEDLETDPTLKPDDDWDDSVVALVNYPEVVELLNEDLDWTWRLGEAVVSQQADVIAAVELFRDRAYAAGNLKSDDYQLVANDGGTIQITPVQDDVIYVPYYEPERVVVYQPRPVYYYYPRAYPIYYYPYPSYHTFHDSFFWGVTTAFAIGWHSHHLNVFHHSYYGHPYYGYSYHHRYWYRRPDIHHHNTIYVRNRHNSYTRYRDGDHWQPNVRRTVRSSDQRITRTRYYPNSASQPSQTTRSVSNTNTTERAARSTTARRELNRESSRVAKRENTADIRFRERSATARTDRTDTSRLSREQKQTQARQEPSRQPQVRSSERRERTQIRSSERREQPQVRSSERRKQPQLRSSERREQPQLRSSERREQPQVRSSERRTQPQVRQSQPRQQAQVRQSQPKMSAPQRSRSQPSKSRKPATVARNSKSRSSGKSEGRH